MASQPGEGIEFLLKSENFNAVPLTAWFPGCHDCEMIAILNSCVALVEKNGLGKVREYEKVSFPSTLITH